MTELSATLQSMLFPPIVAVHPADAVTLISEGIVIAIFPLLSLFGNVYTVVKSIVKVQVAPTVSQPLLSKL